MIPSTGTIDTARSPSSCVFRYSTLSYGLPNLNPAPLSLSQHPADHETVGLSVSVSPVSVGAPLPVGVRFVDDVAHHFQRPPQALSLASIVRVHSHSMQPT